MNFKVGNDCILARDVFVGCELYENSPTFYFSVIQSSRVPTNIRSPESNVAILSGANQLNSAVAMDTIFRSTKAMSSTYQENDPRSAPVVFVVDGVPERRNVTQRILEDAGYEVEIFATMCVLQVAERQQPSLIVAAIKLPDGNGMMLRNKIRQHPTLSSTPVILLADSGNEKYGAIETFDVEASLEYPFAPGQLVNVVASALQRSGEPAVPASSEAVDIVIDPFAMKISVMGKEVITTTLEFRLIDYLARHQGKVFSRDALLDAVWGDLRFVTPRSVDACIRRIRRKIEDSSAPRFLRTIRGTGYRLDAKSAWRTAGGTCQCNICAAARARSRAATSNVKPGMAMGRAASFH